MAPTPPQQQQQQQQQPEQQQQQQPEQQQQQPPPPQPQQPQQPDDPSATANLGRAWSKADITKLTRLAEDRAFLLAALPQHPAEGELDWELISRHFGRHSRGGMAVKQQYNGVLRVVKAARHEGKKGHSYVDLVQTALRALPNGRGTVYEIQALLKRDHSSKLDKYREKNGALRWKKAVGEVLRDQPALFEAVGKTATGKHVWALKAQQAAAHLPWRCGAPACAAMASPGGLPGCEAKELQDIKLYRKLERKRCLDVWPFLVLYAIWAVYVGDMLWSSGREKWVLIQLGTYSLLALHALAYLSTVWSVDMKARLQYRPAARLEDATHVKVVPHSFVGSRAIVPLHGKTTEQGPIISFDFRKLHFILDGQENAFKKLKYPTKETFAAYRASGGYGTEGKLLAALERWGPNKFVVPAPKFTELLWEQLLAPFFCFQVFCVGLWALDEYWYYSLFTLVMLVSFECTVVGQRLKNLQDVRRLQAPKQPLNVYRSGKWGKLPGDALLPGDVVSIVRGSGVDGSDDLVLQADMLLLAGTCIVDEAVLTGESTPQWKNPVGEATGDEIDASELEPTSRLSIKRDRMHILFGGTKLLQATGDKGARLKTPDGGCLAMVLRTGFGTAQGRLMRTILYSTERVTANNIEAFMFILFLLLFAIAASGYVLYHGLQNPDRDRFKLILNCIMILTSVIPPELPMELTVAVNASLLALARKKVFCTEPFRIPLAGKLTTCCFDKTGTLTADEMILEGVAGTAGHEGDVVADVKTLPPAVSRVLACCQSLLQVEKGLVGDPVEKASVEATGWTCKQDTITSHGPSKEANQIMHRFHFSSVLKRMSTIVEAEGDAGTSWWVLSKGAPEVLQTLLAAVPKHYERCYKHFASEGARVLALAYKQLPSGLTPSELRHMGRDTAESGLTFAGFAIFRSPLKEDSEPALRMLRESCHQLVMITGDAPLTACHTAAQVHIVTRPPLVLTKNGGGLAWLSPDEKTREPFDADAEAAWQLAQAYDLCITGDGLVALQELGVAETYIPLAQVYARVTPEQKEVVVKTLRSVGLHVLMCGDGTNDVGALKGAHVGVALLPPPPKKPKKEGKKEGKGKGRGASGDGASAAAALPPPAGMAGSAAHPRAALAAGQAPGGGGAAADALPAEPFDPKKRPGTAMLMQLRARGQRMTPFVEKMAKRMDDMAEAAEIEASNMVKPGDASMAAPFTAKQSSVMPCIDILKQGRCTLVTTIQMFKILGLLCLSSAYSLSVLYLDGIKLGDLQATLAGVLTAGMFFFISHAQPLPQISKARPHPRVFCAYVFTSLMGQFVVYLSFLMYMQHRAHALMSKEDRQEPDAEFKPNLINTVCFLVNFAIQTMTFAVNYVGEPFNTPLSENRLFAMSVRWSVAIYIALVIDIPRGLSSWFSLVPIPGGMQFQMLALTGAAFAVATAIERGARAAFPAAIPPEKGGLTGSRSVVHLSSKED
ncbi:putative manganese-transporting ATPase PDR2 [Micractinium conductrix]|uniref:Manganese-transporting ATPase PDR2 n=1 Tax=Micractinium conductrix TaxID=554055 RepID=A0A2P6VEK5_9CHLO|nr:putative manganese-transporting ATPase PDR2 [Micractinium conductrix]|eukprot:PSC72522.1 putative manganese-transporting ATPase PDR2 [Micractinium conductrix]